MTLGFNTARPPSRRWLAAATIVAFVFGLVSSSLMLGQMSLASQPDRMTVHANVASVAGFLPCHAAELGAGSAHENSTNSSSVTPDGCCAVICHMIAVAPIVEVALEPRGTMVLAGGEPAAFVGFDPTPDPRPPSLPA